MEGKEAYSEKKPEREFWDVAVIDNPRGSQIKFCSGHLNSEQKKFALVLFF
jgi:hypothetical protein